MRQRKIELYKGNCWRRLLVDGEIVHEGHEIPESVWLDLLEDEFSADVTEEEKPQTWWDENWL